MNEISVEALLVEASDVVLGRVGRDAASVSGRLRSVIKCIQARAFDPSLRVSGLAKECGISSGGLATLFRKEVGTSVGCYIREVRLQTAKRMLEMGRVEAAAVASAVGFSSYNAFSKAFCKWSGMTPGSARPGSGAISVRRDENNLLVSLRRAMLHGCALADTQQALDVVELASLQGHGILEPQLLWDMAQPARLEFKALELLWPQIGEWGPAQLHRLPNAGYDFLSEETIVSLFEWSREGFRDDREEGVVVAELGLACLEVLRGKLNKERYLKLRSLGFAHLGNARRLAGDLIGARRDFSKAKGLWQPKAAEGENAVTILWLESALCLQERRLDDALDLTRRILECSSRESTVAVRALLIRGISLEVGGCFEEARSCYAEVLCIVSRIPDLFLELVACSSIATLEARQNDFEKASKWIRRSWRIAEDMGSARVNCHLFWIEALICEARREYARAIDLLHHALEGFVQLNDKFNSSILTLDLVRIQVSMGNGKGCAARLLEVLPILESLQLQSEGLVAIRLLSDSVKRGTLDLKAVIAVRDEAALLGGAPRRLSE